MLCFRYCTAHLAKMERYKVCSNSRTFLLTAAGSRTGTHPAIPQRPLDVAQRTDRGNPAKHPRCAVNADAACTVASPLAHGQMPVFSGFDRPTGRMALGRPGYRLNVGLRPKRKPQRTGRWGGNTASREYAGAALRKSGRENNRPTKSDALTSNKLICYSPSVKDFLANQKGRFQLERLPAYAPELNPTGRHEKQHHDVHGRTATPPPETTPAQPDHGRGSPRGLASIFATNRNAAI